jgi:hypothetical protein
MTGFATLGLNLTHETLETPDEQLQQIEKSECHVPLGVTIIFDIVFALAESIPKFDCSVTRTGDNLSIVGAEADG